MGRKPKEEENTGKVGTISDCFKTLDKLNPDATFLDQNTLSKVSEWISTNCYALNTIISGDPELGIPSGRCTLLAGPPASGKTLIINSILAQAQKMGRTVVIFDSEFDKDENMVGNVGLDCSLVKYVPINSIEQTTLQMVAFLDAVIKNNLKSKFIIALDSLGNLASDKEIGDGEAGKAVSDMGMAAKAIKSMFRQITFKLAKADCPLIVSMHTYDDPAAFMPSAIKNMKGGSGPQYMSSVSIQLTTSKEKEKEKESIVAGGKYSGVWVTAMTTKNRFLPPFIKVDNFLSFTSGLDKYSGLIGMCIEMGIIQKNGNLVFFGDEKLGFENGKWTKDDNFWQTKLFPLLKQKLKDTFKYHSVLEAGEQQLLLEDTSDTPLLLPEVNEVEECLGGNGPDYNNS